MFSKAFLGTLLLRLIVKVARSLEETPDIVTNITEEEYSKTRQNAIKLAWKMTQGYFFKKALVEATKKI